METTEKVKRKFKLESNKLYTLRKLRNVPLEDFQALILKEFQLRLKEDELVKAIEVNKLIGMNICFNYKYNASDFFSIKENSKLIAAKIPLSIRKNIETFEKAHHIKTMWLPYSEKNIRPQNHKFDSYE